MRSLPNQSESSSCMSHGIYRRVFPDDVAPIGYIRYLCFGLTPIQDLSPYRCSDTHRCTDTKMDRQLTNTTGQQLSAEWYKQRRVRLTASNFYDILQHMNKHNHKIKKAKKPLPIGIYKRYQSKKMGNDKVSYVDLAMDYGNFYEKTAIRAVNRFFGGRHNIENCGLFYSEDHPFLAATPDGIVKDKAGKILYCIEVKCPFNQRWKCKPPKYLKKHHKTGYWRMLEDSIYYPQVQGQLLCTGARRCVFAAWTPAKTYVCVVPRNEQYIQWMVNQLTRYYVEAYFPSIQASSDIPPEFHAMVQHIQLRKQLKESGNACADVDACAVITNEDKIK